MDKILVAGGAGYIGSHTVVELLAAGYDVVVCDNLCNSKEESLRRAERLAAGKGSLWFERADLSDGVQAARVFDRHDDISAVINFAGFKAVGESVKVPLAYYRNNLCCAMNLLFEMDKRGIRQFIFSSSATVYGNPETLPLTEECPLSAVNPYGATKLMIEDMLRDLARSNPAWDIVILRYFNPVGAHKSGMIGEDPRGIPNNLMPFITQVAAGRLERLSVFGNDYPTPDGSGVRDYIHVVDLAKGHTAALGIINGGGLQTFNLGTGRGISVLEMIEAFGRATGIKIPYVIAPRRAGDVAECFASCEKAAKVMGWRAQLSAEDMCADHWRWQKNNPDGYKD